MSGALFPIRMTRRMTRRITGIYGSANHHGSLLALKTAQMVSDCVVTLWSHESQHSSDLNNYSRSLANQLRLVGDITSDIPNFAMPCHAMPRLSMWIIRPGNASPPSASGSKRTMSRAAAWGTFLCRGPCLAHQRPPRPDPQLVAFMSTRELKFAMMNEVRMVRVQGNDA